MKYFFVLFLIAFSLSNSFTYVEFAYEAFSCNPEFDFYSKNWLGTKIVGRGGTGVGHLGSVTNSLLNPAAFYLDEKFEAIYEISTKSGGMYDQNSVEKYSFYPESNGFYLSAAKQISEYFNLGIIYYRPHSYELNYGIVSIHTPWNVLMGEWKYERTSKVISIPFNFIFKEKLFFGTSFNITFIEGSQPFIIYTYLEYLIEDIEVSAIIFQPMFGVFYQFSESFSIGTSLLCSVDKEIEFNLEGISNGTYSPSHFPLKLSLGTSYRFTDLPLKLFADVIYEDTGKYDQLNDKANFALGCEYTWNSFILSTGMQTYFDNRTLDYTFISDEIEYWYWGDRKAHDLYFLTAGIEYNYKAFQLKTSFVSSKLSHSEYGSTQFSFGIGLRF